MTSDDFQFSFNFAFISEFELRNLHDSLLTAELCAVCCVHICACLYLNCFTLKTFPNSRGQYSLYTNVSVCVYVYIWLNPHRNQARQLLSLLVHRKMHPNHLIHTFNVKLTTQISWLWNETSCPNIAPASKIVMFISLCVCLFVFACFRYLCIRVQCTCICISVWEHNVHRNAYKCMWVCLCVVFSFDAVPFFLISIAVIDHITITTKSQCVHGRFSIYFIFESSSLWNWQVMREWESKRLRLRFSNSISLSLCSIVRWYELLNEFRSLNRCVVYTI